MLQQRLSEFRRLRMERGPLPKGIAPRISSSSYGSRQPHSLPTTKAVEPSLSREGNARCASTLKTSAGKVDEPAAINLGTARPASDCFPFEALTVCVQDTEVCSLHTEENPQTVTMEALRGDESFDLDLALNYGFAGGSPQLLRFVTEHVELMHDPPNAEWRTSLTCGTTSAIDIVFRMLCDPGDCVLTEEKTYSGIIEAVKPLSLDLIGLRMDEQGLIPEDLEHKMRTWDKAGKPKPSVLYTIPSGQNPTGATQSQARREAVYAVAEKYDLLIIEDDPYYFLQLGQAVSTIDEYWNALPPSLLSMDRSSRVIRLDSCSKILGPGLRCGWITASSILISKFMAHTEFSSVAPSGPSQMLLFKLLDEAWGHAGFLKWLMHLSGRLTACRDVLLDACTRHLPAPLCQWRIPTCGMFAWIQLDSRLHPDFDVAQLSAQRYALLLDIEDRIYTRAETNGVQVSKGSWFTVDKRAYADVAFRLTFAASTPKTFDSAVSQFAMAVREVFRIA